MLKVKGTFALAVMFDNQPDQIFAVRNVSPIVVAATAERVDKDTLVIAISLSGETIDTLEVLKYARKCGSPSISIVNVKGVSIARASEYVIYTNVGPEIAVASTKARTTQLAVLYLIIARMALARGIWDERMAKVFMQELLRVPEVQE